MEKLTSSVVLIQKEELPAIKFSHEEVLSDPNERKKRFADVSRATVLGNGYQGKVTIFFQTDTGETRCVSTTLWDADENYIILKSGASIPLKAVERVEFF